MKRLLLAIAFVLGWAAAGHAQSVTKICFTPSGQPYSCQAVDSTNPLPVTGTFTGTSDVNLKQYGGVAVGAGNAQYVQPGTGANFTVTGLPGTSAKVTGTASQATGGTTTTLITAVPSNRIYVTGFSCANTGSTASLISFQDGSGGTTLWTTIVPAGGGSNLDGTLPLFWTTSGNALFFDPASSSTTVYCSAAGFSGQ